jgi:hypothetical protein
MVGLEYCYRAPKKDLLAKIFREEEKPTEKPCFLHLCKKRVKSRALTRSAAPRQSKASCLALLSITKGQ